MATSDTNVAEHNSTGNEAWAPFVAAAVTRPDERHRQLRYRSGYYTFIASTAASHLLFVAALIADASGYTISSRQAAAFFGGLALFSILLYLVLSRQVWTESMQTARMRFDGNRGARKIATVWILSTGLLATGMFFIANHFLGEMPVGDALVWAMLQAIAPLGITAYVSLKRASRREREEWSR